MPDTNSNVASEITALPTKPKMTPSKMAMEILMRGFMPVLGSFILMTLRFASRLYSGAGPMAVQSELS